jgi:SAM-dependent methyltransferase
MSRADREKWDARYAERATSSVGTPGWLAELDEEIPRRGRALDIGAGTGRAGLWAARRGLDVTLVDISEVGLRIAREAAEREGLRVETIVRDLEVEPLPEGPFALITCFSYEHPALWPKLLGALGRSGVIAAEVATQRNLERHARPPSRFLAAPNALLSRVRGLEVVYFREGWLDGHHKSRIVARRR